MFVLASDESGCFRGVLLLMVDRGVAVRLSAFADLRSMGIVVQA